MEREKERRVGGRRRREKGNDGKQRGRDEGLNGGNVGSAMATSRKLRSEPFHAANLYMIITKIHR